MKIKRKGNHSKFKRKEKKFINKEIEPKSHKRDKKWSIKSIFKFILLIIVIPFAALIDLLRFIGRKLIKPILKFILKNWKKVLISLIIVSIILVGSKFIYDYTNSLNNNIRELNTKIDEINLHINDMVEKDQKLQEDLNLLSEQNGTTLEELEQKKKELEEKEAEVNKLKSQVSSLKNQVTSRGSTTSRSSSSTQTVTASSNEYQQYAHDLCINTYGWSENDFTCLVKLWNRESGWNPNSHNKSSGAHGIPQSLPASKMASEGSDYYTNGYTQIRWGLKYIAGRYGTPSAAWTHSESHNWY